MALEIIIGVIIILTAVAITWAVLKQSSKNDRLSGAIAGGSETFFGKAKGKKEDIALGRITIILTVVLVVFILVMYVFQVGTGKIKYDDDALDNPAAQTTAVTTTTTTTTTAATTTTATTTEITTDSSAEGSEEPDTEGSGDNADAE